VLLWEKQSSVDSTVVRIDLETEKQTRSAKLGKSAWALAVGGDHVWIAHDERLSALDEKTLGKKADMPLPSSHHSIVAGAGAVFVDDGTAVARIDPATMKTFQADLHEPLAALAVAGNDLLVASRKGKVWRLDAATLAVKAELAPEAPFTPQAIAASGDWILVTTHESRDAKAEHGTLLVIGPR
jgi:hypothetical protein